MSKKQSAGLLLFREVGAVPEVLLVHPGGPFWAGKDDGAWSIPKGEFEDGEHPLEAARREFREETGAAAPAGELVALEPVRQPSGKLVHAWMLRGEFDVSALKSNMFAMEWPPRSGRQRQFPEVDRAAWLPIEVARRKISRGQLPLLTQLERRLGRGPAGKTGSSGSGGAEAAEQPPGSYAVDSAKCS